MSDLLELFDRARDGETGVSKWVPFGGTTLGVSLHAGGRISVWDAYDTDHDVDVDVWKTNEKAFLLACDEVADL